MAKLSEDIVHFLHKQSFIIISTIDKNGCPHTACKGIVHIDKGGENIYLLDLYKSMTYENIKNNPCVSITAVNEHKYTGYCVKGLAKIIEGADIKMHIIAAWEGRIATRLTKRVMKEVKEEAGHPHYPEASLPKPEYMIIMKVRDVVDLAPHPVKKKGDEHGKEG